MLTDLHAFQKHVRYIIDVQIIDINNLKLLLKWNDPELNINWMIKRPILSKKDKEGKSFSDIKKII